MFIKRTVLVVLPALFACSLSIGQLQQVKSVYADTEEVSSTSSSYDIENEMFTIRKTGDHAIELLFSANPKKYKNFRKTHLDQLKNSLTEILKDIVHTKITELSEAETTKDTSQVKGEGGEDSIHQEEYTGSIAEGNPEFVHPVSSYVSLATYAEMLTNYVSEDEETGHKNLHEITRGVVVGYAYYWVKTQIERNGWDYDEQNIADVFNDFCSILAYRLFSPFGSTPSDVYSQFYGAGESILEPAFELNLDHVSGMLLLIKNKDDTGNAYLGVRDLLDTIGGQDTKDDILSIVTASSRTQLINFFRTPTNVIQAVMDEIDFTGTDLNELIENVGVETFIDISGAIGVDKTREVIQAVKDFSTSEFIEKVTELTTARDVWSAIKTIHIDGVLVMKDKQFLWEGLCDLFGRLPPLSELKNLADNKWRHNFHVVLETAVEEVVLDVNLGFKGNCKLLRKLAKVLDSHIKIKQNGDHFNIEINVPDLLANMYRYLCDSEFLDDDLKHELWDLAFSNVEEAYEHIHQKTIDDLMENAEQIDYKILAESIISADEIKEFFGISRFVTQDRVDKFVDAVFKAINKGSEIDIERVYELVDQYYEISDSIKDKIDKIYEQAHKLLKRIADRNYDAEFIHDYLSSYTSEELNEKVNEKIDYYLENARVTSYYNRFQRLLEKVYGRVPEKYRHLSLMEYYRGNSVWSGHGEATFNITKLVRKIPKVGPKIADFLSAFFDHFPNHAIVDFKMTTADLYRISYHVGDEVKTGALPTGANAQFFANKKTIYLDGEIHDIVCWAEKRDTGYVYLSDMPARDVDAYPVWFTSSADVIKTFDGVESTIGVTPNIELDYEYSYSWYKDGEYLFEEKGPSITVRNYFDSGTYYCVVDGVKQDNIVVQIDKVVVEPPTQTESIIWNGEAHDYYTSFGATSEEGLVYHGSGDVSAVEPGSYTVQLEFNEPANYVWASGDGSYSWTIQKQPITVLKEKLIWDYTEPFVYDGTEKSVHLVEELLPEHVHAVYSKDYAKTNAGEYVAKVNIVVDDPAHYVLVGEHYSDLIWNIEKAKISIPAEVELVQSEFDYDGKEHAPKINEEILPAAITEVKYSGDVSASDIGDYTVKVSYVYDHANYYLEPGYQKEFNWKINPHIIDVSNVTWDYTNPFTYDETKHSVSLINVPTGVKVEYTGDISAVSDGTYVAHGKLYTTSNNRLLYKGEFRETVSFDLEWKIVRGTPVPLRSEFYSEEQNEAGTSLVWISLSSGIKGDYTLHAEEVDISQSDFSAVTKTGSVDVVAAYDINLFDENNQLAHINVDSNGKVIDETFIFTVRILVPELYQEKELVLTYKNDEGEVSKLSGTRQGSYMVFTTTHLSIYGLVEVHVAGSDPFPYEIVAAAATLAVQATACWILIMLAKRKRRTVK